MTKIPNWYLGHWSNKGPFDNPTAIDHSDNALVMYSNSHCIIFLLSNRASLVLFIIVKQTAFWITNNFKISTDLVMFISHIRFRQAAVSVL